MKHELTDSAMLNLIWAEVKKAGSMRAFGKQSGLSVGYISDVLKGRRDIGPSLAQYLGFDRIVEKTTVTTFRKSADRQSKKGSK